MFDFRNSRDRLAWSILAAGSATLAAFAVNYTLQQGWRRVYHEDPPLNPAAPNTSWATALTWTAAAGLAVGVAQLATRRLAASGWQQVMGKLPPGLESHA